MEIVRFAVWGIGIRGKATVRMLKGKIACIVENNVKYHGTYYEEIPIVCFNDYLEKYAEYPIIVTPREYTQEIVDLLADNDITHPILYSENTKIIDSFGLKFPIERFLKKYEKENKSVIYGQSFLGYLLYDFMVERGYMCALASQSDWDGKILFNVNRIDWNSEAVKGAQVILTLPLTEEDKSVLAGCELEWEKYYETIFSPEFYYYPELERFKNLHQGKRCFIVATGPSLLTEDLDKLYEHNEICMSMNGIFAAFDKTRWRPDYYLAGDVSAIIRWNQEITSKIVSEVFIADMNWIWDKEEVNETMHKWHIFRDMVNGKVPLFSDDFARGTYSGWTITYDGALQLAVYMGFSEIYLLGVDCNYKKNSQSNYFFKQDQKDTMNHCENDMILAYRAAEQYARVHGIRIYNATRGGMLEEFERVDFDSLFE